ncbi:MAG: hypothetical protein WCL28_04575 [bacterium]
MKKCLTIVDSRLVNSLVAGLALALALAFNGCSSSGEDDASLEVTEPVEAAPQDSAETTAQPPAPADAPAPAQAEAQASSAPAVPAQPEAQSAGTVMNTSKRVLYVKVDTAVLREQADAKAKVVGKANRGDHFFVSVEGDWAKTEYGKYISMKVLSERGIGRQKKSADWGESQPEQPKKKRAKKSKAPKESAPVAAEPASTPMGDQAPPSEEKSPAAKAGPAETPATDKK